MPKLSVIIPVYNVGKYLHNCIDSILCQQFNDFELILVNDGSTDSSLNICRQYASKDSRLNVIDKPNGGVSSARNRGISEASGEWITFIDADDWIESDYLLNLVNHISEDTDLIQSGIKFFRNEDNLVYSSEVLPEYHQLQRKNQDDLFKIATLPLITSPVSKLYRNSLIKKHNLRFNQSLSYGEDRDFNLQYIDVAETVSSIAYAGYHYRKGLSDNLSNNKNVLYLLSCDLEYWNKLKNFFEKNNSLNEEILEYLANRLFHFYNDRLNSYIAGTKDSFLIKKREFSKIQDQNEYYWLCEHINYVDVSNILRHIYKSHNAFLLLVFFKILKLI